MYKLGLSTCGKTVDENLFKSYSEAGIKAMEISMNREDYDSFDYENGFHRNDVLKSTGASERLPLSKSTSGRLKKKSIPALAC